MSTKAKGEPTNTNRPYSVAANVKDMKKFVLFIQPHADPKEPKVVPIRNGDYQLNVIRNRYWIVPEAIITVIKDAKGDQVSSEGLLVGKFNSYPWSAQPYDGPLPLRAEVDEDHQPIEEQRAEYPIN